jgi:hypothetical protein
MKAERLLLTMIVAAAILVTPSILTSAVLAQGTADEEDGNQGTTGGEGADDGSPEDMYQTFQTCLEAGEEGAGGAGAFATEDEIRDCFIEAGYVPGTDNDEEENEGDDEETNN